MIGLLHEFLGTAILSHLAVVGVCLELVKVHVSTADHEQQLLQLSSEATRNGREQLRRHRATGIMHT